MAKPTKRTHKLKTVNPFFEQARDGLKNFEVRFDDRDFNVGDIIILQQYRYEKYTGEEITRTIKYILRRFKGLQTGYVVLGLEE